MGQTTLLEDDFETGNLNSWTDDSTNHWAASTLSPISGTYSLKHENTLSSGDSESFLYQSVSNTHLSDSITTWRFNMKNGSFDPSGVNNFGVLLMGDQANPVDGSQNGYYVGVNFNGTSDDITLHRITNGSVTDLITAEVNVNQNDLMAVKVVRKPSGSWELFVDNDEDGEFNNFTSYGLTTDNTHTTFSYTSFYFDYNTTGDADLQFDDFIIFEEENNLKAEPNGHPSDFTATGSIKRVNLSWNDASSSPTPDGYLIKANNTGFGSITDPTDSNAESDDTDLSDGSAVLNVLQGTQEASFSGLDETTTYYFKIYPYTNSGSDIDYKTDGTVPQDDATTLETPDIVLNEFLADPDATTGDANRDGIVDTDDDEFIELVNTGTTDLDISNWVFSDNITDRYTFPEGTVLKPLQAAVIFGGGTPTGDFGGSFVDSTSSLGLNNTGETVTLKNASGIEIINFTYGSEANNDESVTRNPDLTGDFSQHETADTDDASSFSPGTRIDGSTFQPSFQITGNAGWRMLSFPITGGTVSDISDDTAIQGITGGDNASDAPNFLIFKSGDATADFTAPADVDTDFGDGFGFITYFYDNTTAGSSELPITLDAFGQEPSSNVTVNLNGTGDFTLVGNPFASNFDLSAISVTGGTIQDNLQFWDASANTGAGSYVAVDRTSNITSAWQGFWAESQDDATSITFPTSGKTTDSADVSYSKENTNLADVNFTLSSENTFDKAIRLSFRDDAETGWDVADATKLIPLTASYATMGFVGEEDLQSVFSLPLDLQEEYEVQLQENIAGVEGEFTFEWEGIESLPSEWNMTLHDYETGKNINMRHLNAYTFEASANAEAQKSAVNFSGKASAMKKSDTTPRFGITVMAETSVTNEPTEEPKTFTLEQNYPNPFNPVTQIQYSLANAGDVTLEVYNIAGQRVETLVNERKSSGTYRVSWDAANMASGIYYYRLQAGNQVLTRQMTLIK